MGNTARRPEFRLLGPLEVRAGREPVPLGGAKPRALLARLLLARGTVVSADLLIDELWGASPPRTASAALQNYVSQLRRALARAGAADMLVTQPPGYHLDADSESVDAARFERLLAESRDAMEAGEPARASASLRAALDLWRGPALADFAYEPFAQEEIARLEELRLEALEERIEAELALGHEAEVLGELEALAAAHPLRERLWGQLMLARYRAGRQADSLAAYRTLRETLDRELGLDPGPGLRALEVAILRQDEVLLGAAPGQAEPRGERRARRLVVALACGLGERPLGRETIDPETLDAVLDRCHETLSRVVEQHGGVAELAGDEPAAIFGAPLSHEDDALRAARAAVELRAALEALGAALERELGAGLELRLAIEAGEALVSGSRSTGGVLRRARALARSAAPNEILVGPGALPLLGENALVAPLPGDGVAALVELPPDSPVEAGRETAPLVGREAELAALAEILEAAVERREPHVAWVVGPPGIGKSRLARELLRTAADRTAALVGRCPSYGADAALAPMRTMVEQGAGGADRASLLAVLDPDDDADRVAQRLSAALGGEGPAVAADEVPWLFRRFCEALARQRPLVIVVDDVHRAEPALLDAIAHLAGRSSGQAILVVCLARDEILEERPGLLEGVERATLLPLAALSEEESSALADELPGAAGLDPTARATAVEVAEGNPLFLEQLLAFAGEPGAQVAVPPTIQALLAARLDRLGAGERQVLEAAAVVGREPTLGAVADLLEPEAAAAARRHLDALVRRDLLEAAGPVAAFDEGFRFRHALVHDAALAGIPKERRAELHERHADLLERRAGVPGELDEAAGYHLEQAYRLREELGRLDRRALRLAEDAGTRLAEAGMRAWRRYDAAAASNLLGRATALLPAGHRRLAELLCELAIARRTAGATEEAEAAVLEAIREAEAQGDRRVELRGRIEQAAFRLLREPEGVASELLELAGSAVPVFEALGDDRSLGRTWMLAGWVQGGILCRNAGWQEAAERALVHYKRWAGATATCIGHIAAALYYGPAPVGSAVERCERLLVEEVESLAGEATVLAFFAGLVAMQGRFDEAFAAEQRARTTYGKLGQDSEIPRICAPVRAAIQSLAGDLEAAERSLREACGLLDAFGDRVLLSTKAAALADAIYRQGRYEEARRWLRVAAEHAAGDDLGAQIWWRYVGAKLEAQRARHAEAGRLASEAVALVEQTDRLNDHAAVLVGAAEVHRLADRLADAGTCADAAIGLFEEKGNIVAARVWRAAFGEPATA